jgi:hypothetical protein
LVQNINKKIFFLETSTIFIQTKDEQDFKSTKFQHIKFLNNTFCVTENDFKTIPNNSIVFLDDFILNKTYSNHKNNKSEFLNVINYYLRHHNITLFLIIHNLYSNGLLNEILLAPHIFLAYSNLGYYIMKKLLPRLGGTNVLDFFLEPPRFNYHFCYINCNKNYIINYVEKLFSEKKAIMFANQEKYIIHSVDQPCEKINNSNSTETSKIFDECKIFLTHSYPKNKILPLVVKILTNNNLLNNDLFFNFFSNIHLADFLSFLNNKFGKKETTELNMIKLCKYLNHNALKFPKIAIKNPVAQKYLL